MERETPGAEAKAMASGVTLGADAEAMELGATPGTVAEAMAPVATPGAVAKALAPGTTPRAALSAGAAAGLGSRGLTLSESERTRAAEGVEVVEEDEVDEGLEEEEDAMAVGPLRGGRGREDLVWRLFGF